ncbi:tetratricopeptide repeat protein [bacterium]|nr:MAG: tetratricopeptide repeat protein [bacterium]
MQVIKSRFVIILLSLTALSCSTIKDEWGNFTAYYNTFYNAKTYYQKGYDAIVKAQEQINSEKLIRVTETPSKAGFIEFDKSIDKSAKILREYDKTKWVDDALLLIGKSYYFQVNYFSAEEKFVELYENTTDKRLIQLAVYWNARAKFELRQYEETLEFIDNELSALNRVWDKKILAEIRLVEAETYVKLENFDKATELLHQSIKDLDNKQYEARAWFLLGQLEEKLGNTRESLNAYSNVARNTNDYNLVLISKRKQAEIARNTGKLKESLALYNGMLSDDKNYDIYYDLLYEVGKIAELQGNYSKAESIYKEVLYNKIKQPTKETAAKTHYGLAQIQLNAYKNLTKAAAYFDTSSVRSNGSEALPEDFDAPILAKAYGEYARLEKKRVRYDSLLHLSTLTTAELDSVIEKLKEQKKAEYEAILKKQDEISSSMINASAGNASNQQNLDESNSAQNGFLNYKNQVLVQQARDQFMAIWGNRPLADNWRRQDAIKNINLGTQSSKNQQKTGNASGAKETLLALKIDLNEIPKDSAKKADMKEQLSKTLYEMGNVFYLNLSEADSAKRYYERILNEFPSSSVYIQTQYTYSELLAEFGNSNEAFEIAKDIHTKHPKSIFASTLRNKYDALVDTSSSEIKESNDVILAKQLNEAEQLNGTEKAERLKAIAKEASSPQIVSKLLSEAALTYIELARTTTDFDQKNAIYIQLKNDWESMYTTFNLQKDSLRVQLNDSLKGVDSIRYFTIKQIVDSTLVKPAFNEEFPFVGSLWDSTRVVFQLLKTKYSNSKETKRFDKLIQEIQLPAALKEKKVAPEMKSDSLQSGIKP